MSTEAMIGDAGARFIEFVSIFASTEGMTGIAGLLEDIGYDVESATDPALLAAASIAVQLLIISTKHAQEHAVDGATDECHLDPARVVTVWTSMRELAR